MTSIEKTPGFRGLGTECCSPILFSVAARLLEVFPWKLVQRGIVARPKDDTVRMQERNPPAVELMPASLELFPDSPTGMAGSSDTWPNIHDHWIFSEKLDELFQAHRKSAGVFRIP
jgi:hypothetical protein